MALPTRSLQVPKRHKKDKIIPIGIINMLSVLLVIIRIKLNKIPPIQPTIHHFNFTQSPPLK